MSCMFVYMYMCTFITISEYFGSEPVVIEEEKTGERESGRNSAASTGVKRSESQRSTSSSVVASVHDVV